MARNTAELAARTGDPVRRRHRHGLPEVAVARCLLVTKVKVIKSGELDKAVKVKGLAVTKGARAAIEAAGGSIE